ncbi:MAG TPA: undecaprenyl-phosphate glucose phosphotransferase [Ignavibacteriaceae bacterium]|nr:undecaprenyl-phosphate glucose phosphotransferase [Ignavibacteriaceae bacterium]
MIVNKKSIYYQRLFSDLVLLNLSFLLAAVLAQPFNILLERNYMFILLLLLNILWFFNASITGFYNELYLRSISSQIINISKSVIIQIGFAVLFIFLAKENLFTRNFIVFFGIFLFISVSLRSIIFKEILRKLREKGKNVRNLLIIGAGDVGINFKNTITNNPEFGYKFVGFLDNGKSDPEIIGRIDELDNKLKSKQVDEVVIALQNESTQQLDEIIRVCNINAAKIHIIPDYFRFLSNRFQVSMIGNFPVITARDEPLEEVNRRFIKRTFDILFSTIVIIFILSWLFPIIAILTKLTSRGPVLFLQERIGARNESFKCYKFRTMIFEQNKKYTFKPVVAGDERVTKLGRILRRSNIDELPQFFNVLKGEMSVVGPRPHAIPYQDMYGQIFEEIKLRHNVKPGITGWAQVNGLRGDVEDEELNRARTIQRMKYDLWYIENWSMKLDMQIILMTIWQMITGDTKAV